MTRTWKLEDAKTHLSQLIRDAEQGPQVITRHGKAVAVINALSDESVLPPRRSALSALRGDYNFSDFPDEDWLERDRSSALRELEC